MPFARLAAHPCTGFRQTVILAKSDMLAQFENQRISSCFMQCDMINSTCMGIMSAEISDGYRLVRFFRA